MDAYRNRNFKMLAAPKMISRGNKLIHLHVLSRNKIDWQVRSDSIPDQDLRYKQTDSQTAMVNGAQKLER